MKVAIIGGSGKMGQWFASFLLKAGHDVLITGRSQNKLVEVQKHLNVNVSTEFADINDTDVVLISVPIDSFEDVTRQLQPFIHAEQIVVDITSVKAMPVAVMHQHLNARLILGTHPVFGPGARDISKQNFVLTPINQPETEMAEKIKQYLETRGARVVLMSPQEHDEMMSVILGLAHFITIVSADTLLNFDRFQQTVAISGTTYRVLLTLIESVLSEDPELYASLQMHLPGLPQVEEEFLKTVRSWADTVNSRNRQDFVSRMNALKTSLERSDTDFKRAYENMYRILEE